LVRLRSGEYICVDTNSLDSIDYLLGWPLEGDFLPVFRRFLAPDSVVLDIGANFGLYTATTATIVRQHGRLYAFEGNPHTFGLLRRTLYANRLAQHPNVIAVNALIGQAAGRRNLYYMAEYLGGATMTDIPEWGAAQRSVEVETIAIDDFLPADLAVDLVKIDVEGHEPFVVRGMQKTIRRSPNIRIFLEFVEAFLVHTVRAEEFVREIDELGLRICRLLPGARLAVVERGQTLRGANFCLLTRTPEEDSARVYRDGRRLPVRLMRWLRWAEIRWDRSRHAPFRW
jgi:FkbM family methyltransferase